METGAWAGSSFIQGFSAASPRRLVGEAQRAPRAKPRSDRLPPMPPHRFQGPYPTGQMPLAFPRRHFAPPAPHPKAVWGGQGGTKPGSAGKARVPLRLHRHLQAFGLRLSWWRAARHHGGLRPVLRHCGGRSPKRQPTPRAPATPTGQPSQLGQAVRKPLELFQIEACFKGDTTGPQCRFLGVIMSIFRILQI